ncbi:uncharacterized protein LOC119609461 [Lucilia sericata]|uniref:uncharacterized protein LOC119609461 n=1 Tax=Lucilia sericata TaxID=13632 RepID=UPI0018A8605C|nr:uncharacterized protein LOC119609461 [Lucilia sericata]
MSIDSYRQSINETLYAFALQFEKFVDFAIKTAGKIGKEISDPTFSWKSPIQFTSLQWTLFKLLCILLLLTSLLICYSWRVYGKVITDKFVRPSTLKEIEELKLSVAKLKLPKEHSPRI